MKIPSDVLQKHLGILGINGSGKTYTAKGCVETLLDRKERVCVIDPTGVWWGLKSSASGKSGGYPVVVFGGEHADLPISGMHGETIAEAIGTSNTPAIIDTSLMRGSERTRFFTDFAETLRIKNSGPLHLFIDEAHLFCPQGRVSDPHSAQMLHAANNLISLGRARGLRVTLISQRPAKMHKDSLTQVHSLIAMRLIAPHDRAAVEDWIADQADPVKGKGIIASLPSLKTGEGYLWAPELGILEKMKFPKITTFDSSAAPDGGEKGKGPKLTPIDLAGIEGRLANIKIEAVKNDPAALKRRIAELEKLVKEKNTGIDPEELKIAEGRGYGRACVEIKKNLIKAIKSINLEDQLLGAVPMTATEIRGRAPDFFKAGDNNNVKKQLPPVIWQHKQMTIKEAMEEFPSPKKIIPVKVRVDQERGITDVQYNGDLTGPENRVITSLNFWKSIGHDRPLREQVSAVAGYTVSGSSFIKAVSILKTKGMIDIPAPGLLGMQPIAPRMEMTMLEAKTKLISVLDGPKNLVLSAFVRNGGALSRDEAAKSAGYTASGSSFIKAVSGLTVLNILERPSPGMLNLSEWAAELLT